MKYVIEVHHQTGITTYHCENFWDVACSYIDYCQYRTIQDAEDMFDDEIPEELTELLKNGPVLEINGKFHLESEFDKEKFAFDFLAEDLNRLIVIETAEDAEFYETKYKDHEWIKVRAAAREIREKLKDGNK